MPAPGALAVGKAINPVTGSAQVVLPRSGQLLGFFVQAASVTVVLYDGISATVLPTPILNSAALGVGWQPFPVDLNSGLVANVSGAVAFVVL